MANNMVLTYLHFRVLKISHWWWRCRELRVRLSNFSVGATQWARSFPTTWLGEESVSTWIHGWYQMKNPPFGLKKLHSTSFNYLKMLGFPHRFLRNRRVWSINSVFYHYQISLFNRKMAMLKRKPMETLDRIGEKNQMGPRPCYFSWRQTD